MAYTDSVGDPNSQWAPHPDPISQLLGSVVDKLQNPSPTTVPLQTTPANGVPQTQPTAQTPQLPSALDSYVQSQSPAQVPVSQAASPTQGQVTAPPQSHFIETDGKHTGVAGVARDIFGTLGDILLKHLGLNPMYGPAQQRRREGEALSQYQTNPEAAAQQMGYVDPQLAQTMQQQLIMNGHKDYAQVIAEQNANTRQDAATEKANLKARTIASGMLSAAMKTNPDGTKSIDPAAYAQIIKMANAQKYLAPEDKLPDQLDPNFITSYIGGSINPYQQANLGFKASGQAETERHDKVNEGIGEQNAGSNAVRAQAAMGQVGVGNARNGIIANDSAARDKVIMRGQDLQHGDRAASLNARQTPPVGYKNQNGLVFKGGDPHNRANWQ